VLVLKFNRVCFKCKCTCLLQLRMLQVQLRMLKQALLLY